MKIALLGDSENIFSEKIKSVFDEKIEFIYESSGDFEGLIIVSDNLDTDQKKIIFKSNEMKIPIIGIDGGFDGLNLFFGGNKSIETEDKTTQLFMSPGAKLSHIVGGSGWVKSNFQLTSKIYGKDLSESFFSSIISDKGEIIGFEKPGNEWQFGIKFDVFSQDIPRGFENIISVFLDKCSDFVK